MAFGAGQRVELVEQPHLQRLLALSLYLGPRKDEALSLQLVDVDLQRWTLCIHRR